MGVAEDQDLVPGVPRLGLQIVEVDLVGLLLPDQRVVHQPAPRELRRQGEGVVDGLLDDDPVAGLGEQVHQEEDGGHHAAGGDDPLLLALVAVAAPLPIQHRVKIGLGGIGVALYHGVDVGLQSFPDLRRGKELHVRRGHRQHVGARVRVNFPHSRPFAGAAGGAVDNGGKIVSHTEPSPFY